MSKRQRFVLFPKAAANGSVDRTTVVLVPSLLKLKIVVCIVLLLLSLVVQLVNGSSSLQHNFLGSSSQNILDNINLFEKIYISYHHCVWNNDNTDCTSADESNLQQDDIVDTSASSYWYMGKLSSCYKPSIAYTLYGTTAIIENDTTNNSTSSKSQNPCRKATYINSYYTTSDGLFEFINSITASGNVEITNQQIQSKDGSIITTSQCIVDSIENDYQIKNIYHNEKIHMNSISYGFGCSTPSMFRPRKKQSFVYNTYSGQYCDPNDVIETTNTLDELNNELDTKIRCVVLYDKSSDSNSNAQQDQNNNNDNVNSPLDILENSRICSVHESGSQCPDPYRFKKAYHNYQYYQKIRFIVSYILLGCGILFMLISFYMIRERYGNNHSKSFSDGNDTIATKNTTIIGSSSMNGSNHSQNTITNRGCWGGLFGRRKQRPEQPPQLERKRQTYKERRSSSITKKNQSKPPLDSIEIDPIPVTNYNDIPPIRKTNSTIIEILFGNSKGSDEKSNTKNNNDNEQQQSHQKEVQVQNKNNNDTDTDTEEYPTTLVSNLTETNTMMLMNLDDDNKTNNNNNYNPYQTTTTTTTTTTDTTNKRMQAHVIAKERSTSFFKKVFQRKQQQQQQQLNQQE